ncbi:MAG TPA: OmpA family protein [Rhizomicrobium sp.]
MQRPGIFFALTLGLTGCIAEAPPPIAEYYPPPYAPSPPRRAHEAPRRAVAKPEPRPEEAPPAKIRPLNEGMLTALTVGNYMDIQEKTLRAALRGTGSVVSRVGDNLVLDIRADALFDAGSTALSQKGKTILRSVAESARKFDSTTLRVNGFTDTAAAAAADVKESQMFADAVDRALVASGVDPHRISAKGFGAENLRIPTGPHVSEPRNRRIEIEVAPRVKT